MTRWIAIRALLQHCWGAKGLPSGTRRTGTHRLLSRPKAVLSGTIGPCRRQSARSIGRRVVSGNYGDISIDCRVSNKALDIVRVRRWATSAVGPGCVKTRGRSIAIEQLSRSRPFDVPALRAHSISWPNTKISFSSRFGILSFHTAWARCRPRPRSPLASVARGEADLLCSLRDIPSLTRSCENSKARRTARMIFSGSSENLSRFAVWPLKKGPKRIICSITIKRLSVFTRPGP